MKRQLNLRFNRKDIRWYLLRLFSNLQFSIILLLLIAIFSTIGTVIEQNKESSFYQTQYTLSNEYYNILNWKNIELFGFIMFTQLGGS